jgi:hypothetical protein
MVIVDQDAVILDVVMEEAAILEDVILEMATQDVVAAVISIVIVVQESVVASKVREVMEINVDNFACA